MYRDEMGSQAAGTNELLRIAVALESAASNLHDVK